MHNVYCEIENYASKQSTLFPTEKKAHMHNFVVLQLLGTSGDLLCMISNDMLVF